MLVHFRARFDSDSHNLEIVAVSRLILDYLGVSGSIWEHLGASGASGNIWELEKSQRITRDDQGRQGRARKEPRKGKGKARGEPGKSQGRAGDNTGGVRIQLENLPRVALTASLDVTRAPQTQNTPRSAKEKYCARASAFCLSQK